MSVCVSPSVCLCVYIYVSMSGCESMCLYVCVCVWLCVCMCVYVSVCMFVSSCVSVCVSLSLYLCVCMCAWLCVGGNVSVCVVYTLVCLHVCLAGLSEVWCCCSVSHEQGNATSKGTCEMANTSDKENIVMIYITFLETLTSIHPENNKLS